MAVLLSYVEANRNNYHRLGSGGAYPYQGQAINLAACTISSLKFYLAAEGSPTGNAVAVIRASTGTVGTNAYPTGGALATSGNYNASGLGADYALIEFTFATPYVHAGGDITIELQYAGVYPNDIFVGCDTSSPGDAGNLFYSTDGAVYTTPAEDIIYYVYGTLTGWTHKILGMTGGLSE
jgi:hypothetical protein